MKDVSAILAVMSFIAAIGSLVIYLRGIRQSYHPNPNTWAIWVCGDIINAYTYISLVKSDVWESLFVFTETVGVILVFCISYFKSRKLNEMLDAKILVLVAIIFIFAVKIEDKNFVNLTIQSLYGWGTYYTVRGIRMGTNKENIFSYVCGVVAALLSVGSIITNFHGEWAAFVSPLVMLIGDIIIIFVSRKKK